MTVKKRGGRESSDNAVDAKQPSTENRSEVADSAAAKPAAHPAMRSYERHICGSRCTTCFRWRGQRIRALEAELAAVKIAGKEATRVAREWITRAEKAEAEVKRLRKTHDDWCEYRKRLELSFALGELSGAIKGSGP